jgi:hypothetical protein
MANVLRQEGDERSSIPVYPTVQAAVEAMRG